MHTAIRIAKKLAASLGITIATIGAFALFNDGTRTTSEVALIVFALGTTFIIVGLLSQAVQTRQHQTTPAHRTIADELARLAELHERGHLTDHEFSTAKRSILGTDARR